MERIYFDYKDAIEALEAAEKLDCFYTLEKSIEKSKNLFGNYVDSTIFRLTIYECGEENES